jgi:hypothetical protein
VEEEDEQAGALTPAAGGGRDLQLDEDEAMAAGACRVVFGGVVGWKKTTLLGDEQVGFDPRSKAPFERWQMEVPGFMDVGILCLAGLRCELAVFGM